MTNEDMIYPFQPPKKNFVDKSSGTVHINGELDDSILTDIIPALDDLMLTSVTLSDSIKVLRFRITSHGGNVEILFALLDQIEELRRLGFRIETHIRGYADSCASLLAAFGDKGYRTCGPYSASVVHHFSGYSYVSTASEIDRVYANNKRLSAKLKKLYLSNSKMKEKEYDEMIASDFCELDAKELLKKGLIDTIVYNS